MSKDNSQIESLAHWKAEATHVIDEWESVYETFGSPGTLGRSKAANLRDYIQTLLDDRQRFSDALRETVPTLTLPSDGALVETTEGWLLVLPGRQYGCSTTDVERR
jgi:hypothetical protein